MILWTGAHSVCISCSSTTCKDAWACEYCDTEGGKAVQDVSLYISKTQFVDGRTSVSSQTVAAGDVGDMSSISLNADVPELTPTQNYVFVRVGVKIMDVEDMLFSNVEKIQLN